MIRGAAAIACLGILVTFARAAEPSPDAERHWPQWRGPHATGVAPHGDPPVEWSESKNVRWKVRIPGRGHATPIIWGDHVYVQTAVPTDRRADAEQVADAAAREPQRWTAHNTPKPAHSYKFQVLALHRSDGRVVWKRTVREAVPHEGGHADASQASNSAITDGEYLYVYFGSRGLYCFDLDGNLEWQQDLGEMKTRLGFGEGSSPALHGDTIVLNWDDEGDSFIIALNKKTGKKLWQVDRDEVTSWSTPIVVNVAGQPQVIVSATNFIRAYDLTTGELIWKCSGMTRNVIPSPVFGHGLVYALSGFRGSALLAIRPAGARGDITGTDAIVWRHDQGTPYVPSPLLYDDTLYFLSGNKGIVSCFNAKTGAEYYGRQRLQGLRGAFASPVGARDRVYILGRDGTTVVLRRGPRFDVLATNVLEDGFDASPAIAGKELYLRGHEYLYCIAED